MSVYVAWLRIDGASDRDGFEWVARCLGERESGVIRVQTDYARQCLSVWFDRQKSTLGDLVRALESRGVRVLSVAQTRDLSPSGRRLTAASA